MCCEMLHKYVWKCIMINENLGKVFQTFEDFWSTTCKIDVDSLSLPTSENVYNLSQVPYWFSLENLHKWP